ncbi:2-deoxy-scyllo-inosamine dehydrogenase [Microbacterium paludicola]|uniref:2-deoxy-scyllo-inosamine dehydrogenase n=1 Tax=Microbacterium paludicola TaxID=300019 RepID=A0A4Y9FXR6_9MICO|nr:zinc-dependent alcohol dehydrogenase family protein [Microbacterium paludicola]MBF0815955.1 zinc-dependent alcohol dehydrogenase family protein [Microbacterium paludicola]TFU33421.1 2-deoxy-scyllo-inosamine dehydrogenase [Microbacterium paludicola]
MPATMKAVVYDRPEHFEIRELPVPEPGPGEVLLRVLLAGVCGTDLHLHVGEFGPSYPLVPGHEIVGEVVRFGADSEDLVAMAGLAEGMRVVLDNTAQCGECAECLRQRPAFCLANVAHGVNAQGGFAEYVVIRIGRCYPADDLDVDVAVFAEPTACVVHGLDVLGLRPGSDVLLFGAGPTGLLLTQLLSRNGAARLTVAAPTVEKLELARRSGATRTVRVDRQDPETALAHLRANAPRGYDVVVDATGAPSVLESTIGLTRTGGTVFVYGMTPEATRWPVASYEVFRRELTIKGSFAQQFSFDRALAYLRSGVVNPSGYVTHRFGIEQYADALAAVADSACVKAVIAP